MGKKKRSKKPNRKPGRPITRIIKLDATPEESARRIFANAKSPDPSLRSRPECDYGPTR